MNKLLLTLTLTLSLLLGNKVEGEIIILPTSEGDSTIMVNLREVVVRSKKRSNRYYARQERRDARLIHNVRRAYPYAKMAAEKIREIDMRLSTTKSEKEQKQMINEEYKELMKTFKKPLSNLTITQGKILVRLIYRETQKSSFHHIKDYRGGVSAYFWQSLALLFGNNLKADYEPDGRDLDIEMIVKEIERQGCGHNTQ